MKPGPCFRGRFDNIKRTGRTGCVSPNLQNYPSRDKIYPLKNIFTARNGRVLCATDFSFIELCGFAQSCYTRFGFSVMRDIINAGVDPHRWFAAVMYKRIKVDLGALKDPKKAEELNEYLKTIVTDEERGKAKMANFGKLRLAEVKERNEAEKPDTAIRTEGCEESQSGATHSGTSRTDMSHHEAAPLEVVQFELF